MRNLLIIMIILLPLASKAFIGDMFEHPLIMKPGLGDIAKKLTDVELHIQLDIGHENQTPFAISGMVFRLNDQKAPDGHTSLPGANGKNPTVSTGARHLDLVDEGQYITIMGTQHVAARNGCWEMCWRKDKPAGTLVCGFQIPKQHKRNAAGATLPKGKLYLSFPLWTVKGLRFAQKEKKQLENEAQGYLDERDVHLNRFELTDNPIMKAFHLHNAYKAVDAYSALPHMTADSIPQDDEVIALQEDVLLNVRGMVWAKEDQAEEEGHLLLGSAILLPQKQKHD